MRVGAIINRTSAVNTASAFTRGFINVMNWVSRAATLGREANRRRDNGIVEAFIIDSSSQRFFFEIRYFALRGSLGD